MPEDVEFIFVTLPFFLVFGKPNSFFNFLTMPIAFSLVEDMPDRHLIAPAKTFLKLEPKQFVLLPSSPHLRIPFPNQR